MRVNGNCCGDCSKCALLAENKVDMIPCMIDQVFQRVQKMEEFILVTRETHIAEIPEK